MVAKEYKKHLAALTGAAEGLVGKKGTLVVDLNADQVKEISLEALRLALWSLRAIEAECPGSDQLDDDDLDAAYTAADKIRSLREQLM